MDEVIRGCKAMARRNVGFALFLAWNYMALYGCGMAIGSFVPYNLEYIWLVAAVTTGVCALALLGRARGAALAPDRRWGVCAAACAVAGNVALWLCYAFKPLAYWVLFPVAGVLDGVAIALFTVIWGARLTRCNEARIEFDVVACLVLAFAVYAVTLPVKLWGLVDVAVGCACPVLSAWLAFRPGGDDADDAWIAGHPEPAGKAARPLRSCPSLMRALVMMGALWFLVAFLRVVDAPIGAYDRYGRYLIAFSIGFFVTFALFLVLIHAMRFVDMSMAFRWLLPFAMLNVAVLGLGRGTFESHVAAYAVIHAGMFGMQMSTWIALAKYLRRTSWRHAGSAFAGYAAAEGLGIALGCACGLAAVKTLDTYPLLCCVVVVVGLVVLVVMTVGFDPSWYFTRMRREHADKAPAAVETPDAPASAPEPSAPGHNDAYEDMMRERAAELQGAFGLTERETEVAALLLGGRSRPYIRDELGISLNTVHAHAHSILAKCGVHSQRELIDLETGRGGK